MSLALVVDDDPGSLHALASLVELEGLEVRTAGNLAEAREILEHRTPSVILTDLILPDGQGTALLEELEEGSAVEVVLVTGHASLRTAVEALRLGAYDYLTKPVDEERLKALLAGVRRTSELKSEIGNLRQELREMGQFGLLVGTSDPMQKVYDLLSKGAPSEASILLVGESGTGKELAAKTTHRLSKRRRGPFVAINCGAVSPTLIESQLFGHEKGAFTGADRRHQGYFEQADQGTLFLDEITEMPADLQVKLLRVLETGTVTRVGGTQSLDVDVRIVAATNREPQKAVDDGSLRQDLYYRLKVFPVYLPPLRDRGSDVPLLSRFFLKELCKETDTTMDLSVEALKILRSYPWPGNVRELKNVIHRAFILAEDTITQEHLAQELSVQGIVLGGGTAGQSSGDPTLLTNGVPIRIGMSVAEAEKELILATLDAKDGDKKKAADILGISLKTLYNRLRTYRGV